MKTFSSDWIAALEAGGGRDVGAVEILCDPPVRWWGGIGALELLGETYVGIGQHGLVKVSDNQLGGAERSIELTLSGVDPDVLALIVADDLRGSPVTILRLGFDNSGRALLDAQVYDRGKLDRLVQNDTAGGEASLKATVMSAARGGGRATGRMAGDADQRLIDPDDGGMARVSQAGDLTLAWGGKPPASAGRVLPTAQQIVQGAVDRFFQ